METKKVKVYEYDHGKGVIQSALVSQVEADELIHYRGCSGAEAGAKIKAAKAMQDRIDGLRNSLADAERQLAIIEAL